PDHRSGPVRALHGAQGGLMATSTPPAGPTNLGVAPNVGGLLCYLPCCIGFIFSIVVAIVEKQSRFLRFHAFQSLLFNVVWIVLSFALQIGSGFVGRVVPFFALIAIPLVALVGFAGLALTVL